MFFSVSSHSKIVDIHLGGFATSKSIYRGALIWDGPSAFVGPSFTFYKKLSLRGPSVFYRSFKRKSPYVLNYSVSLFTDRKPFITTSSKDEGFRNSRSSSVHAQIHGGYRFGFMKLFELGARVSYEVKNYNAWYVIPYFKMPVAPFVSLNLEMGVGEKSSNQYLYGSFSKSGIGYRSIGLSSFIPLRLGRLILSGDYISVEQSENRKGVLVGGRPDNFNFSIRYFVKTY